MFKRSFLYPLLVLLALALGGCTKAGKPAAAGKAADPRRAFTGTTLKVLLKTGYESEAIKQYAEQFETATGMKVEYEIYDEPTLRNKLILDTTSRTGNYDVVAIQFWYMPEYLRANCMEALDDYISQKADKEWLSINNIPEGLLDTYRDSDGRLYALPVSASGGVLIYRKDLLEKHGLKAPETTKDVLSLAKALKEKEESIYPFIGRGDSSPASFGTSAGWAWAYGARVLNEQGEVTVDTPAMREALNDFITLMRNYAPEDQAAIGWDVMSEIFRQGNAAMNFEMSGFPSVYANPSVSSVADKIEVALIKGPSGNYAQWMYGEGLGLAKFSKQKEAAWLFLQWRTSLQVALEEVADGLRYDFPDSRVYEKELYQEKTESIHFFTSKLSNILTSVDTAYWPNVPEFQQVAEAFQRQISLAISGRQSVNKALNTAQRDIERIMAESPK